MKPEDVKIMCLEEGLQFKDGRYHFISIRNSSDPRSLYIPIDKDPEKFAGLLVLEMDDLEMEHDGYQPPREYHVKRAIDFVQNAEKLAVHCTAGVCRSSAIAYICSCVKMPLDEAVTVVSPKDHWPNSWVVQHGAKILANPAIFEKLKEHMQKQFDSRNWPHASSSGYM